MALDGQCADLVEGEIEIDELRLSCEGIAQRHAALVVDLVVLEGQLAQRRASVDGTAQRRARRAERIRGRAEERESVLMISRWHSEALSGTQWHSIALGGNQWQSEALGGNQWQSRDEPEERESGVLVHERRRERLAALLAESIRIDRQAV